MKKLIRIIAISATFALLAAVTAVSSASANTPGIRVTVRDSNRNPIPSALVQFVRSTSPASMVVHTFRSDMWGVAMFPNAPIGTYGINVTHPDFASTSATSFQVARSSVYDLQLATITMTQPAYPFFRLNWAPILADMGTISNPTYEISSVYGWREWASNPLHRHNGIDIVRRDGTSLGRRVHTPFSGSVMYVYTNPNGSAGFGIVLQYRPVGWLSDFFVRYLHLQDLPRRADGTQLSTNNSVARGEQVGLLGNTPRPHGTTHLHMDVHRDFNPSPGPRWENTIDPRAFFAPRFVAPWPHLNIQN